MAFQSGTQVNPALGRADYSGYARAGEMYGNAIAQMGQIAGSVIKKRKQDKIEKERNKQIDEFVTSQIGEQSALGQALGQFGVKDADDVKTVREMLGPSFNEMAIATAMQPGPKGQAVTREQLDQYTKQGYDVEATPQPGGDFLATKISPFAPKVPLVTFQNEKQVEKELIEIDSGKVEKLQGLADNAESQQEIYGQMLPLLDKTYTGIGGEIALQGKKVLGIFGVETEGIAEGEMIQALGNQLAMRLRNPESGMGLTGNTSDRDITFLKDSVPNIEKTAEGNRKMIKFAMRINERKIQKARMAEDYFRKNKSLEGWNEEWQKFLDNPANDLFANEPAPSAESAPLPPTVEMDEESWYNQLN